MRRTLLVALGWLLLSSAPALAQPSAREAAEQVRQAGGYESRLPLLGGSRDESDGAGLASRRERDSDRQEREAQRPRPPQQQPPDWRLPFPTWAGKALTVALIAGFVLLILGVIIAGARADWGRAPLAPPLRAAAERPEQVPLAVQWVDGDPDALAAEGRYEEALAALLIRSLLLVGWKPSGAWRGRTAREVLQLVGASDARHTWLLGVVQSQELVAFAGLDATRERFASARSSWEQLRQITERQPR